MSLFDGLRHRTRALTDGARHARELDEEIDFHLSLDEMQAAHAGASPLDARAAARRRFGNVTYLKEETRRMAGLASLDAIRQDVHFALRTLRRAPLFTIVAALTLALGIGATTATFSIVSSVLLRPLPYRDAGHLASVFERRDDGGGRLASYLTFRDWQAALPRGGAVEGLAFVRGCGGVLRGDQGPENVIMGCVTPGFFALAGAHPLLGRTLGAADERAGAPPAVVLSHAFWQRRFGGDRSVVGRTLDLEGAPVTVVGVMPAGFAYPQWAMAWRPIAAIAATDPALAQRGVHVDSRVLARLAPGADSARGAAALALLQARQAQVYPAESAHWTGIDLLLLRDETLGGVKPMLLVLAAAVALVLLLACANVANLALVRAAARERELAVRGALGARRGRLVRQLLTESLVLALAGGALGVALASVTVGLVRHSAGALLPRAEEVAVDWRVLLFALAVSVLAALVAGAAPAAGATAPARLARLRSGVLGAVGGQRDARVRGALAALQLGLALVLLVGAGLLVQSFRRLEAVSLGFDPDRLVATALDLPKGKYATPEQAAALYTRLLDAVRAAPGVRDAALVNHLPLSGSSAPTPVELEGGAGGHALGALYRTVSDRYLTTLGVRLVRGRFFTPDDMRSPASAGIVINESAAKQWWPGGEAVGRRITVHRSSQARADFGQPITATVIGVIGDVRGFGRDQDPSPEVYVPYTLEVWPWISIVARTANGAATIPAFRNAILGVDPNLPMAGQALRGGVQTMDTLLAQWSAQRRFLTALLGAFAMVALLLAAIGLYGVMAYGVAQRTRELGVRLALGATAGTIQRLVLREAATLAVLGILLGLAGSAALARVVRSVLFRTTAADPATLAITLVVLSTVMLVASWIPARRATRLDPVVAMRGE